MALENKKPGEKPAGNRGKTNKTANPEGTRAAAPANDVAKTKSVGIGVGVETEHLLAGIVGAYPCAAMLVDGDDKVIVTNAAMEGIIKRHADALSEHCPRLKLENKPGGTTITGSISELKRSIGGEDDWTPKGAGGAVVLRCLWVTRLWK